MARGVTLCGMNERVSYYRLAGRAQRYGTEAEALEAAKTMKHLDGSQLTVRAYTAWHRPISGAAPPAKKKGSWPL